MRLVFGCLGPSDSIPDGASLIQSKPVILLHWIVGGGASAYIDK